MKVLLFTHKNDIDGMGNVILARLAFNDVSYELCGTFDLTEAVNKYYEDGTIYNYDRIFVTDLCLEEPILGKIANDEELKKKILVLDHHKTFLDEKYTKHSFIKVKVSDEKGLCCGTSLFYEYLINEGLIDKDNNAVSTFVELTRQHDTWEWKNIYNNEQARRLAVLFDAIGYDGYINLMSKKLVHDKVSVFEFNDVERDLINNKLEQIDEMMKDYSEKIFYREILGMKAGIVFIDYEYRNELAEYFRENKFDMDFVMMVSLDRKVVSYRSVKDGVIVRSVAELFGGKGHERAASNPISKEQQENIIKILIKE